jgi:hypothetical protein
LPALDGLRVVDHAGAILAFYQLQVPQCMCCE